MAILKKYMLMIVFAVICLASIGTAVWACMSGGEISETATAVATLNNNAKRLASSAQNAATIAERRKQVEEENARLEESLNIALGVQKNNAFDGKPRRPLIENILPKPESTADRMSFRTKYIEAHKAMMARLRGRPKATDTEIHEEEAILRSRNRPTDEDIISRPWGPSETTAAPPTPEDRQEKTGVQAILSEYARARAEEKVAREILMYVGRGAIPPHRMAEKAIAPSPSEIWEAQMSLWIEQDLVTALAKVNAKREAQLTAEGRPFDAWVANMPIKHLKRVAIPDRFGTTGGDINRLRSLPESFTKVKNDNSRFVIPIQLDLVVEEAAVLEVIDSFCSIGFYTPIRVDYMKVEPTPLQDSYIYGDAPVVAITLNLEGYYFRKVFDEWIPKDIKETLSKPEARKVAGGRG